jgi:hypothetical protein
MQLIKFRKGIPFSAPHPAPAAVEVRAPVQQVPQQQQHRQPAVATVSALEFWQVPNRFKRRTIDAAECDFINVRNKYICYHFCSKL